MIGLYTAPTHNGWKASVVLEEMSFKYNVIDLGLDLGSGVPKEPDFLATNPNGGIPAIIDRDNGDFTVFESGVIMIYLAEKTGQLLPQDPKRIEVEEMLATAKDMVQKMIAQRVSFQPIYETH